VGPTGQTPRSNRPSQFGRIEPVTSPTSLTCSRDAHGDCVASASAAVPWPSPATSGLTVAAKMTASFRSTFSLEELSWSAQSFPRASLLDSLGFWPWCRGTPMSSGHPRFSSCPTTHCSILGHWSSGSGELLHGDHGHCHCVLPLHPLLELGSTTGQVSNTFSSPLRCSIATLASPLGSPQFENLGFRCTEANLQFIDARLV
jgi:hypothetical protein